MENRELVPSSTFQILFITTSPFHLTFCLLRSLPWISLLKTTERYSRISLLGYRWSFLEPNHLLHLQASFSLIHISPHSVSTVPFSQHFLHQLFSPNPRSPYILPLRFHPPLLFHLALFSSISPSLLPSSPLYFDQHHFFPTNTFRLLSQKANNFGANKFRDRTSPDFTPLLIFSAFPIR